MDRYLATVVPTVPSFRYVEDESSFCSLLSLLLQWITSPSTGGETAASGYRAIMEWLKVKDCIDLIIICIGLKKKVGGAGG